MPFPGIDTGGIDLTEPVGMPDAVRHTNGRWLMLGSTFLIIRGIVGLIVGVLTFLWPGITALALIWFIAAWAVVTGVLEIAAAIRLRREITGEWLLALSGVLSVAFGLLVIAFPSAGALGIAWLLGAYAAAAGIVLIVLGVRLHSHAIVVA